MYTIRISMFIQQADSEQMEQKFKYYITRKGEQKRKAYRETIRILTHISTGSFKANRSNFQKILYIHQGTQKGVERYRDIIRISTYIQKDTSSQSKQIFKD